MEQSYLKEYLELKERIERCQEVYAGILDRAYPGETGNGMPGSAGAVSDKTGGLAVQRAALSEKIDAMTADFLERRQAVDDWLDSIPDPILSVAGVLRYRYFLTWGQVAEKMRYSSPHTIRTLWSRFMNSQEPEESETC